MSKSRPHSAAADPSDAPPLSSPALAVSVATFGATEGASEVTASLDRRCMTASTAASAFSVAAAISAASAVAAAAAACSSSNAVPSAATALATAASSASTSRRRATASSANHSSRSAASRFRAGEPGGDSASRLSASRLSAFETTALVAAPPPPRIRSPKFGERGLRGESATTGTESLMASGGGAGLCGEPGWARAGAWAASAAEAGSSPEALKKPAHSPISTRKPWQCTRSENYRFAQVCALAAFAVLLQPVQPGDKGVELRAVHRPIGVGVHPLEHRFERCPIAVVRDGLHTQNAQSDRL